MLTRETIEREAARVHARVVELRRTLHREPELGLATPKTQALIVRELSRIGIDGIVTGTGCTSVWVDIEGTAVPVAGRRRVALRADMDALPLTEHAEIDWASCDAGKMHACGHDGHVAMLIGAAEILHTYRAAFAGTVRLLFQPGEEGYGGAQDHDPRGCSRWCRRRVRVAPRAEPQARSRRASSRHDARRV